MDIYLKNYLQHFAYERLIRTAAYIRVSTEEQKKHGFSVEAQKEGLQKYANEKGYIIVEWYIDEGFSARKKSKTRKALTRLVRDAKQNKFEMIIFKCIDRWFRNISEYYKIQEILEDNNINWECSEEDFDTTTREGRLKLNLYLMLAQDEADRGSERIKYVFNNKISNGEAICGDNSLPFGFKTKEIDNIKRVVIDETRKEIVDYLFDSFELTHSKRLTTLLVNNRYDVNIPYRSMLKIIENPMYYGAYRFNEQYIYGGSYLSKERWLNIQEINKKNIRKNNTNNTYLFSTLIKCNGCNAMLVGSHTINSYDKSYIYYRCNNNKFHTCNSNEVINEEKLEKKLLEVINPEIKKYIASFEIIEEKPKPKIDTNKIKKKIEKLNELYIEDRITKDQYDNKYKELSLKLELANKREVKRDLSYLSKMLNDSFENVYSRLDKLEKRALWRSFIKSIEVIPKSYEIIKINFL